MVVTARNAQSRPATQERGSNVSVGVPVGYATRRAASARSTRSSTVAASSG